MISMLLAVALFLWAKRCRHTFVAALIVPSIFFYYLAYELRNSDIVTNYFDFGRIQDYNHYLLFGVCLTISALFAFSPWLKHPSSTNSRPKKSNNNQKFSWQKAETAYYTLSLLAMLAFAINLSRIGLNFAMLFVAPREYEEIFGKSTMVNYLYFLNVPALCLCIYCKQKGQKLRWAMPINTILIAISFFHGIKFTVFDTLLIPALFYYHGSRTPAKAVRMVGLSIGILFSFYMVFSLAVRGATDGKISPIAVVLNYILPNYYNFAFSIEHSPLQFDLFSNFLPDKMPNPFTSLAITGNYGFTLSDKFNMATAFPAYYSILPIMSWLSWLPIVVWLRLLLIKNMLRSNYFHRVFMVTYVDYCLFFTWYFFAFNKSKYVYYLLIFYLVSRFVHRPSPPIAGAAPSDSLPGCSEGAMSVSLPMVSVK